MIRTSHAFSILQAIVVTTGLAILLWSVGLPSIRFAQAANITSFSDTLSDSAPSIVSNHTISFVTPTGIGAGDIISLTFPAGFTGIESLDELDIDMTVGKVEENLGAVASGATWGVNVSGQTIDIESGASTIDAGALVTIEIGTNATIPSIGNTQITNPIAGSYEIDIEVGGVDSGTTRVIIMDTGTVAESVDTVFTFTINGVTGGVLVNTNDMTGGATTATTIPFGILTADTASTVAQDLQVTTNVVNGFVVTVQTDQQLLSANGADIDGYIDGSYTTSPTVWTAPGATPGSENEYSHWGLSSADPTVGVGLTDVYSSGDNFVSASTTPVEVFRHDGPTDGTKNGEGRTSVIYKTEITALQEAADDYTATLTYIATSVF